MRVVGFGWLVSQERRSHFEGKKQNDKRGLFRWRIQGRGLGMVLLPERRRMSKERKAVAHLLSIIILSGFIVSASECPTTINLGTFLKPTTRQADVPRISNIAVWICPTRVPIFHHDRSIRKLVEGSRSLLLRDVQHLSVGKYRKINEHDPYG